MQRKLAMWSAEKEDRRFYRLLRLIAHPIWLEEAARITLSSRGANTPGTDGVTRAVIEPHLKEELEEIRNQLLHGTYQPTPARRVYIPKSDGRKRPLGIPALRDRIVQRAMLMAMEPIWESDFHQRSYGFRPTRSVHHAIQALKVQLTDSKGAATGGRWVIEGDLRSYFDTVHHRILMKCVRRRICDKRFLNLLWKFIKAGHVEKGLFMAASEGVPQGGVISPLLSNIMLHEFDQWLEENHLNARHRSHIYTWNRSVRKRIPKALKEERKLKPSYSYCRYADDFVIVVRGNRQDAEEFRNVCRKYLEETLHLELNMKKTLVTHIDDGFDFLGHHIIRKRGGKGTLRPVTMIPWTRYRKMIESLKALLTSDFHENPVELIKKLNSKITGWSNFYKYTDYTATVYNRIDSAVFWMFGRWLAKKYRTRISEQIRRKVDRPPKEIGHVKTWRIYGLDEEGKYRAVYLKKLVGSQKERYVSQHSQANPYQSETRKTRPKFSEIAIAMSS
jgi:group II intron reverse transcriptase/maturase